MPCSCGRAHRMTRGQMEGDGMCRCHLILCSHVIATNVKRSHYLFEDGVFLVATWQQCLAHAKFSAALVFPSYPMIERSGQIDVCIWTFPISHYKANFTMPNGVRLNALDVPSHPANILLSSSCEEFLRCPTRQRHSSPWGEIPMGSESHQAIFSSSS